MSDSVSKYFEKLEDKKHWAEVARKEAEEKAKAEKSRFNRIKCFFSTLFNF